MTPGTTPKEERMATDRRTGGNTGGIGLGGILVIVGIVVMIVWSVVLGIIIALVGLVAFGGFAKGKWY
jgi:predicted metalloprotease